ALSVALPGGDAALADRLAAALADHQLLASADREAILHLTEPIDAPCAVVPRIEDDVSDLGGLARIAARL
ncbi:MAG: hypothetical protein WCC48_03970, partial [Anaeromyxobacteraceae bacterium]